MSNEQNLYRNHLTHFKLWDDEFRLEDVWDEQMIEMFIFDFGERITKSGGIRNMILMVLE